MSEQDQRPAEILIVDDDESVRGLLSAVLSENYTCFTGSSGDEALRLLETHLPDLIISDINMPGMTGLELLPKVSALAPDIVTMVISGNQTIDNAIEAIRAGAFDFIKKPFELDHVEMAVRRALEHRSLLVEKREHDENLERLVEERTKQLHFAAYYDDLTGLPNRRLFEDRLTQWISRGDDRQVALLLIAPDRFKDFRDTLGHTFGAKMLKEFAERLSGCMRGDNIAGRFEGDEFAIMLPNVNDAADVTLVTNEIFEAMKAPFAFETHEIFISTAIGISLFPGDGNDSPSLMKNAGAALSHSINTGTNNYQFYTGDMQAAALRRFTLENDLRHSLEKGQLEVHYQPKVNNSSGKIVGMEALIRWRHHELGMIPPLDFIPIGEETGMIVQVGEWILREACKQTKVWQDAGYDLHVAVNVSAAQFDLGLADSVRKIINETGFDPAFLNLEMTESAVMKNAEFAITTLKELKALGIRISIDDFGTGYSSLIQLKSLPIDVLKIDKSFINDVTTDADDASLVTAIVGLARNLRLSVVAEGVETAEQLEFLNTLHCDEWQGYLFSKPLPADEFTTLLADKHTS